MFLLTISQIKKLRKRNTSMILNTNQYIILTKSIFEYDEKGNIIVVNFYQADRDRDSLVNNYSCIYKYNE